MSFRENEMIGAYRLEHQLGAGGMATVYKARHAELEREVAIKVLHAAFLDDANFRARFRREARLIARLEHPNIVPIYDYAEYEGHPYLVMKYIDGQTLRDLLASQPLTNQQVLEIAEAVGAALECAHRQNILHRDVKPSNVLISKDWRVYLADFGLARLGQGSGTLTANLLVGTPQYLAPEQAQSIPDLDARADIYSFGIMLYEMLAGRVPFDSDPPITTILDHLNTPVPLPSKFNPAIQPSVERVLLKALEKDRNRRYAQVSDLVDDLRAALAGEPPAALAGEPPAALAGDLRATLAGASRPAEDTPNQTRLNPADMPAGAPAGVPETSPVVPVSSEVTSVAPVSPATMVTGTIAKPKNSDSSAELLPLELEPAEQVIWARRQSYQPGLRKPFSLPSDEVELPQPEIQLGEPPAFEWLGALIPPVVIIIAMLVLKAVTPLNFLDGSMLIALVFPIGNAISYYIQKRNYKKKYNLRLEKYRAILQAEQARLQALLDEQRQVLESEYPRTLALSQIAQAAGTNLRLWWRRPSDRDFLTLRLGSTVRKPALHLRYSGQLLSADPIKPLVASIQERFAFLPDAPLLVDVQKAGSLALTGESQATLLGAARRLLLDLVVHISPRDVQLVVISDRPNAAREWGWVKWLPHSRCLFTGESAPRLFLGFQNAPQQPQGSSSLHATLDWLNLEYTRRRQAEGEAHLNPILLVLDDQGAARRQPLIAAELVRRASDVEIYPLFLGDQFLPNQVRLHIAVRAGGACQVTETWEGGATIQGSAELVDLNLCESASRSLARLEIPGMTPSGVLPSSLHLSELLGAAIVPDTVRAFWEAPLEERSLLQFPIGVAFNHEQGVEPYTLNLLPASKGGRDYCHFMVTGLPNSGKREFLRTLVLAGAARYTPQVVNFFLLDFRGASNFRFLRSLPHVAGVVTVSQPAEVRRGIAGLQAEIRRRMRLFKDARVASIWEFNLAAAAERPRLPHLLVLVNDLSANWSGFGELAPLVDSILKHGKTLGISLGITCSSLVREVEERLVLIDWRVVLRMRNTDEVEAIAPCIPPDRLPERPGHAYICSQSGDALEIQVAYSGYSAVTPASCQAQRFQIEEITPEGKLVRLYTHESHLPDGSTDDIGGLRQSEAELLMTVINNVVKEMGLKPTQPIQAEG